MIIEQISNFVKSNGVEFCVHNGNIGAAFINTFQNVNAIDKLVKQGFLDESDTSLISDCIGKVTVFIPAKMIALGDDIAWAAATHEVGHYANGHVTAETNCDEMVVNEGFEIEADDFARAECAKLGLDYNEITKKMLTILSNGEFEMVSEMYREQMPARSKLLGL